MIRIHNTYVPTYVRPTKGRQAQSCVLWIESDRSAALEDCSSTSKSPDGLSFRIAANFEFDAPCMHVYMYVCRCELCMMYVE